MTVCSSQKLYCGLGWLLGLGGALAYSIDDIVRIQLISKKHDHLLTWLQSYVIFPLIKNCLHSPDDLLLFSNVLPRRSVASRTETMLNTGNGGVPHGPQL